MKKITMTLMLVALSLQLNAQEMLVGGSLGIAEVDYKTDYQSIDRNESFDNITVSGLFDLTYARFGVGFGTKYVRHEETNGKTIEDNNYDYSFVSLSAVGKYPFLFMDNKLSLWPALGFEYNINTQFKHAGKDLTSYNDQMNDFYISSGAGADYFITPNIALTTSFLAGYNLTPETSSKSPSGINYKNYNLNMNFGLMYKL